MVVGHRYVHGVLLLNGPARVAELRRSYQAILRSRVSDSAPPEEQHRWWRLHDQAKREYAVADWKWESLMLRAVIGLALIFGALSVLSIEFVSVAILLLVAGLWRCYVIFTRHAPD